MCCMYSISSLDFVSFFKNLFFLKICDLTKKKKRYLPAMQSVVIVLMEIILYFMGSVNSRMMYRIVTILTTFEVIVINLCSLGSVPLYGKGVDIYGSPFKMIPGILLSWVFCFLVWWFCF